MNLTKQQIFDALRSERCYCGGHKKVGMSHCAKCYYSLPGDIRRSLWKRMGAGYEEAYQKSVEILHAKATGA
jgi:hypothetical protein